jgi:CubicO group peptidase (beta-lactamase class C family)
MLNSICPVGRRRSGPRAREASAGKAVLRLAMAGLALLLAVRPLAAAPFAPGDPATSSAAQRMVTAFKNWGKEYKVKSGSVAIMTGTTLEGSGSFGSYTPTNTNPIASDSKAITAMCIARLVDAKKLTFKSELKDLLKSYFKKNKPADSRIPDITIADLLTHSSGMTYDPSQGGPIEQQLPLDQTNLEKQTEIAFETKLGEKPGTYYFYNNMNYAVLGYVIEKLTGKAYESYCAQVVLKPVHVTDAVLNPKWRIMASWGGWKISADDYARFLEYYLPSQKLLKTTVADWPMFSMGSGDYYTLGAIAVKQGTGYAFFHEGSWQYSSPKASFGSYYVVYEESIRYMTEFAPTVSDDAVTDLNTVMSNAYLGQAISAPPPTRPELVTH